MIKEYLPVFHTSLRSWRIQIFLILKRDNMWRNKVYTRWRKFSSFRTTYFKTQPRPFAKNANLGPPAGKRTCNSVDLVQGSANWTTKAVLKSLGTSSVSIMVVMPAKWTAIFNEYLAFAPDHMKWSWYLMKEISSFRIAHFFKSHRDQLQKMQLLGFHKAWESRKQGLAN